MKQSINKTIVTRAVISRLEEEKKPAKITAKHVPGFDTPGKISNTDNDEGFVPDIAAFYDKETIVYEIELNKAMPAEKWQLFSLYARKNNGSFFLVIPDYMKEPVKEELEEKDINAGVIVFQTEVE